MRDLHFSDHYERMVAEALDKAGISYVHESENKEQGLDFYLPEHDLYIEVKQFHADRIVRQTASQDNVLVVQGAKALRFFTTMIETASELALQLFTTMIKERIDEDEYDGGIINSDDPWSKEIMAKVHEKYGEENWSMLQTMMGQTAKTDKDSGRP